MEHKHTVFQARYISAAVLAFLLCIESSEASVAFDQLQNKPGHRRTASPKGPNYLTLSNQILICAKSGDTKTLATYCDPKFRDDIIRFFTTTGRLSLKWTRIKKGKSGNSTDFLYRSYNGSEPKIDLQFHKKTHLLWAADLYCPE
jgi:hypothetical protein